jgi:H+/gluconate symporter-like permease
MTSRFARTTGYILALVILVISVLIALTAFQSPDENSCGGANPTCESPSQPLMPQLITLGAGLALSGVVIVLGRRNQDGGTS